MNLRIPKSGLGLLCIAALGLLVACSDESANENAAGPTGITKVEKRIVNADQEPQNWLSHGRDYAEARFSPLTTINNSNVANLGLQWSYDLDTNRGQEATPIVVDGILYTTSAWSKVQAFNAVTGDLLWQFDPKVPHSTLAKGCCDAVNRGVAYWGGNVYVGAYDGRLIAIDAKTGKQQWSTVTVDQSKSYTITGAPRAAQGLIFIGNSGSEFGVRGYISAYDARSGELVWRFYTVPGEPGTKDHAASDSAHEKLAAKTWSGNWWNKKGGYGGGTVWDSMAYDSELGLLYFGVGNASYWNKKFRSKDDLDNLFVASVVAVNAQTGEYVWHYQHTPGDAWDYTSTQHMVLTEMEVKGALRKVLMQAPKNGFFYILDRATGELLSAEPYVPVNWADGIDMKTGRPNIKPEALYWKTGKLWASAPGPFGGHNWQPMSYSQQTGLVYIPAQEIGGLYQNLETFEPMPTGINMAVDMRPLILPDDSKVLAAIKKGMKGYLLAWDPVTQKEVWRAPHPGPWNGGILSTAGGLVFQGDTDGRFNAYDANTGEQLWTFESGNMISAAPISYAVDGVQYVTVLSGFGTAWSKLGGVLAWDEQGAQRNKSRVLTFALGGKGQVLPTVRNLRAVIAPPEQFASDTEIKEGEDLYHRTCFACHGSGALAESTNPPDLRYSGMLHSEAAWSAVVIDGILNDRGMVSFKANYSAQQAQSIRAYVISRAQATLTTKKDEVK